MKKIKVKILGLSYSQSQLGSYVLVLSQVKGDKKIPIIIKPNDAQYIALKMEGIKTPRPLTQDLIKTITESLDASVSEIIIHNIVEGVFYSNLILVSPTDTFEIECTIGDAISLSLLYECPLFVSSNVMDVVGIYMNDDGQITDEQNEMNHSEREKPAVTVEDLEIMLDKAVENEEYEIAGQLKQRIDQLKISK
jgi:bifunctional DNase/RNase